MDKLKEANTFLSIKGGVMQFNALNKESLVDCVYFDKSCRKAQMLKKEGRAVGGICLRGCLPAECLTEKDFLMKTEGEEIG